MKYQVFVKTDLTDRLRLRDSFRSYLAAWNLFLDCILYQPQVCICDEDGVVLDEYQRTSMQR